MKITYKQIKEFGPCYDPNKYIPETWEGNLVEILKMTNVSAKDRLWVCVRHQFLTDKQIHLYGLGCARLSEKYSPDPRVKECNDTVEAYLKGRAIKEQLSAAARSAARSAESAARSAWFAARFAESAAESAWFAARFAAESAESAARSAARSAESAARSAWFAARFAWFTAESAAESAAKDAMEEQQCQLLINILEE